MALSLLNTGKNCQEHNNLAPRDLCQQSRRIQFALRTQHHWYCITSVYLTSASTKELYYNWVGGHLKLVHEHQEVDLVI